MTRSDPSSIHYDVNLTGGGQWVSEGALVKGFRTYIIPALSHNPGVIVINAQGSAEPGEATGVARDSFRHLLHVLWNRPEHPTPFASKKTEEKAFGNFEESVRAVVARELARSGLAVERVVPAVKPVPTHVPGYEAAVSAGAEARTRMFKSEGMLSSDEFAKVAGYSRETVNKKRIEGALLALTNGTRGFRYPVWQLEANVQTVMPQILKILGGIDPWGIYLFLTQGTRLLDGESPLECLRAGESNHVLAATEIHAAEAA